jgi:hypothetical protein
MGWEEAGRLMQMVFNIGSPATLVDVKNQLSHLRLKGTTSSIPNIGGVSVAFTAGRWHATNKHASQIGLLLAYWVIHEHYQQLQQKWHPRPLANIASVICSQLSVVDKDKGPSKVEKTVNEWSKRAWPWDQVGAHGGFPQHYMLFAAGGNGIFFWAGTALHQEISRAE